MYGVVVGLAGTVTFILAAVNGVAMPMFASAYADADTEALQRLATMTSRWMFWPALGISLVLMLFASPILSLFSPSYTPGSWALVILAFANLVNVSAGLPSSLLNMSGFQDETLKVVAVCSLFNLVLTVVLIPPLGVLGAALASALAMISWNVWLYIKARRKLQVEASFLAQWLR